MTHYVNEDGEPLPHYKDHVSVTRGRQLHWFSTIRQAERFIAGLKDRAAVKRGEYSINPDLHAIRAYARLKRL